MSEKIECKIPPEGWRCTRYAGHEGPCAAKPTPESTKNGCVVCGSPGHDEKKCPNTPPTPEKLSVHEWFKWYCANVHYALTREEFAERYAAYYASQATAEKDRKLAKSICIHFDEELASEGQGWEVPAEPEPMYFATFPEALKGYVDLLTKECNKLAEKDARIAELTQEVAETENELLEHSKALAAQDKKITGLEAENASLRKQGERR